MQRKGNGGVVKKGKQTTPNVRDEKNGDKVHKVRLVVNARTDNAHRFHKLPACSQQPASRWLIKMFDDVSKGNIFAIVDAD